MILKERFRRLSVRVGGVLPRVVSAAPYDLALRFARQIGERNGAEVWCRNSFRIGGWTFGLSDLDLTIYSERPNARGFSEIRTKFIGLKRWFPWIGEVNFYTRSIASRFLMNANPLELQRDPELLARFGLDLRRSPSDAESAAFLLRMLESDVLNLSAKAGAGSTKRLRKAKWVSHLTACGRKFDLPDDGSDWIPRILVHASELASIDLTHLTVSAFQSTSAYWAAFPNRACARTLEVPALPGPFAALFNAQIAWEIWGLLGQLPNLEPRSVARHLENLKIVHDRANQSGADSLRKDLREFSELMNLNSGDR